MNYLNKPLVDVKAEAKGGTRASAGEIKSGAEKPKSALEKVVLLRQVNFLELLADLLDSSWTCFWTTLLVAASCKSLWHCNDKAIV